MDCASTPSAVPGEIVARSIVVGGQYLLTAKVGELTLKAKTDRDCGQRVKDEAWVECPLDWVTVFDANGHRLDARLSLEP